PGQRRRCARVAARSGIPMPANTTWPSCNWRALRIVRISAAVYWEALDIKNTLPFPTGAHDFFRPDQRQKLVPRLGTIDVFVEILAHSLDGVAVDLFDIGVEVFHRRLINSVAFMRHRTVRHFD